MPAKKIYTEAQIKQLLQDIYDGVFTDRKLPKDLYFAIADYLKTAVYNGYGATLADVAETDLELLVQLRENVFMFSAAKTFQQVKQMTELLTDGENVRSFSEFKKAASEVFDTYNVDYLKTEYNTAIGQAQSAVKWGQIEQGKDIFPLLRYSAIIDGATSDICEPLDGLVAPVNDPIWNTVGPLNHFNCRCVLLQEDGLDIKETPQEEKESTVNDVETLMQDNFKNNPGKSGEVFTKDHPYFDVDKADKKFAAKNFMLPIPKTDDYESE